MLFSRGPVLDFDTVHRLCLEINQQGKGIIAISTYLSPNSVLLMGQNGTLNHFETLVHEVFPKQVALRRHKYRYPPLHTPIMWQRNIPNRTAVLLQTIAGGFQAPSLPLISMVTGKASYQAFNSRELMHRWVDHPQRMWDVVYHVLADGIETVVHVGPNPNLLPATFHRLSNNILAQIVLAAAWAASAAALCFRRLVRRPWLTRVYCRRPRFCSAPPFVQQIILEDWLLEHQAEAGK